MGATLPGAPTRHVAPHSVPVAAHTRRTAVARRTSDANFDAASASILSMSICRLASSADLCSSQPSAA